MRPVRTDVVERPERSGLVANDEPALTVELERDVVARAADFAHVTDDLPRRQEHVLLFELVKLLVVIDPRRQRVAQPRFGRCRGRARCGRERRRRRTC